MRFINSLPPMEQSTVPESPLKDPVDSKPPLVSKSPDPPVKKAQVKKSVSQTPPYAQQLMPTSQANDQVSFHIQGVAVLCIRNNGFTLTKEVVSYVVDWKCPNKLFKFLYHLNVGTICVTDQHSKQKFKEIQASWNSSSKFKRTPVMLLNSNGREHDGPNQCHPRAHFNDRDALDAARETRRIGICSSAGTSPCLHHLPGTQH
ncbi:hypothetical protein TNCV_4100111 [Trichonephila clavipes]|nr:hypothetical protein TNCV_4100111 [Trichonephila clavipes]